MQSDASKHRLIQELWLPLTKEAGDVFFPKLKKNKKMRLLTITEESNSEEIETLIEAGLTTNDSTYGWASSIFKKVRLETANAPIIVIGATHYEDSIVNRPDVIVEYFPFDILNIDFYSQNVEAYGGRIEKEIASLELTIRNQKGKIGDKKGFVLIYTTKIDGYPLNCTSLKVDSDRLLIENWAGLIINGLPTPATINNDKKQIIEVVVGQILHKYGFTPAIQIRTHQINTDNGLILSVAGIFKVS